MRFCSSCGSSRLQFATPEGDNRPRHLCPDCGMVHYRNPKIVVGCLAFYEDKLLLCRRRIEPQAGLWNLPAGFMENGETVQEGARREVREEALAEVEILRLHSIYNIIHVNQVYLLFLARLSEPAYGAGDETLEARLFPLDQIPHDQLAFHSNRFAINRYLQQPDYPGVHIGDSHTDLF